MSLVALWRSVTEEGEPSRMWMAADSRITDATGTLLNEGCKLFVLPIRCCKPDAVGWFSDVYYSSSYGMVCVGGSLTYHNVFGTLIPLLDNLIARRADIPCLAYVGTLAARVTSAYVESLWEAKGPAAKQVELAIGGVCGAHRLLEAYHIVPTGGDDTFERFRSSALDVSGDAVHFFGSHTEDADAALRELRADARLPIGETVAPLRVIRGFIADSRYPSIGGDVQIGYTREARFERVSTVRPVVPGKPEAMMRFNNLDLKELGEVGPCGIGIGGYPG
jgi:hypothetical protein